MAKPYIHAQSSAKKYGGRPEDYIEIHNLMDSSKSAIADNRHRALTHNAWFLFILEKIFGVTIKNSDGRDVSVRDVGEQHILEDFGGKFIPTAQDYIENMEFKDWMQNGQGYPPSFKKIEERREKKLVKLIPWKEVKEKDVVNLFTFDGSNRPIQSEKPPMDLPPKIGGELID